MNKYTYDVLRDITKQLHTLNTQINLLSETLLTQNEVLITMSRSINTQNEILVAIGKSLTTSKEKMNDELSESEDKK